jgi:hypothetical protein
VRKVLDEGISDDEFLLIPLERDIESIRINSHAKHDNQKDVDKSFLIEEG